MEPSIPAETQPPPYRSRLDRRTALVIIVIAALAVVAGAWYYLYGRDPLAGFFPRNAEVFLSPADAGEVPISSVSLSRDDPGLTPLEIGKGEKKYALGIAKGGGTTYYLLLDPATLVANIYRQEKDGTLAQVSDTPTFKNHLAYDAESGRFAYQSAKAEKPEDLADKLAWDIEVFDMGSGETRSLGQGAHPAFLADGVVALDEKGIIYGVDPSTGTRERITAVTLGLWAVDASGARLAIYDPNESTIEMFAIEGKAAVSTGTTAVHYPHPPLALGFAGEVPLALRILGDGSHLAFSHLDGPSVAFPNPYLGTPFAPNQIIVTYE